MNVVSISYTTESGDDYLCQFEDVESIDDLVELFLEQAGEELAYIYKLDLCTNMGLELEMKLALNVKIEEAQQLEDGFYD